MIAGNSHQKKNDTLSSGPKSQTRFQPSKTLSCNNNDIKYLCSPDLYTLMFSSVSAARCRIDPNYIRLYNPLTPRHCRAVCSVPMSASSLAARFSRALQCVCTAWLRSGPCSMAPTPTRRAPITAGCSTRDASPTPGLAQ